MANFNQSPLQQTSLALQEITTGIGTEVSTSTISFNTIIFENIAIDTNKMSLSPEYQIIPPWRRSSRNIP